MKTFQSTSKCRHILMAGMLAWGVLPGLAVPETNDAAVSLAVTQQNVTLKGTVVDKNDRRTDYWSECHCEGYD